MLLKIEHRLAFAYDAYISESFLELRVQPKTTPSQTVASFSLAVGPPTRVFRYRDWNDNLAHHFTVTKFHDRIEVASRSLVETHPIPLALSDVSDPPSSSEPPFTLRDFLEFHGPVRLTTALRELHAGVCQDFAHLALGLLRLRGIPCRYVSGYLHVDRAARDPAQSHAWIEF